MTYDTAALTPFKAATTVAWSEVVVGDRRRPVKIVGLPALGRRATSDAKDNALNTKRGERA